MLNNLTNDDIHRIYNDISDNSSYTNIFIENDNFPNNDIDPYISGGASMDINKYIQSLSRKHKFLKDYQYLIYQYFLSDYMKNRNLLLCWLSVGRGKTLLSISCAIAGIESKLFKRIIILSPKTIQDEFIKNLHLYTILRYNNKTDQERYFKKYSKLIIMIAYNSWKASTNLKKYRDLEHSLFIIDEAHLFFKSVIKVQLREEDLHHKHTKYVGNAKRIYDTIRQLKHKKILALTGTPSAKTPYETVPMFNLAYDTPLFDMSYDEFNEKYINSDHISHIGDLVHKLDGLIAYVPAGNSGVEASPLKVVRVEMSYNQYKQYLIDYRKELDEPAFSNKRNIYGILFGAISSFHAKTFEDCVYWNQNLENTPQENRLKGKIIIDSEHCPKIIKMYDDTTNINGTCVFYFRFTSMYGIECMEKKLQLEGYERVGNKDDVFKEKRERYVVFSGDIPMSIRNRWKDMFNDKRNMRGEYIKYLLLSPSGSVGITLKNVRFLGIGSAEFNYSTIRQILGRVNRLNSHADLPPEDRTVENRIYLMRKNNRYFEKHKRMIRKLCERQAPGSTEIAPPIEYIIYRDSLKDDLINEDFKQHVLVPASITEEIWKDF